MEVMTLNSQSHTNTLNKVLDTTEVSHVFGPKI